MRMLKGLVCLVLGLLMLVLWGTLAVYINYEMALPGTPFDTVLIQSLNAAYIGGPLSNILYPGNLWSFTGYALTFIGIYRIVRSLRERRSRQ